MRTAWNVLSVEWKRLWRNRMRRAALAVALILPLLYSFLYLAAFWDPYGHLDKLPVALVNEDTGGAQDGKPVNFGADLTQSLVDDKSLQWHTTTKSEALNGALSDKYYMVLEIPPSFTTDLLSVGTDHPRKADMQFIPNQGRNYLAGQITSRVQGEIAANLSQRFSQRYITRLLDVVGQSASGLSKIAATAHQLASGGNQVAQGAANVASSVDGADAGARQLNAGMHQLTPGSTQLMTGLAQVQQGTGDVGNGLRQSTQAVHQIRQQIAPLASPAGQLVTGAQQLKSAAQTLSTASDTLLSGLNQAASGSSQIESGLKKQRAAVQQIQSETGQAAILLQGYKQSAGAGADSRVIQALGILQNVNSGLSDLTNGLAASQTGAGDLSTSLVQLQDGQQRLDDGLKQLTSNLAAYRDGVAKFQTNVAPLDSALGQVETGLTKLSSGVAQVRVAQAKLATGASQLHGGLVQSANGSNELSSGLDQLQNGSRQLAASARQLSDGQDAFAGKVKDAAVTATVNHPDLNAAIMSHPIDVKTTPLYPVKQYGPGLAPYFVPLSLWVGALMLFFVISFRDGRWKVTPVSHQSVMFGKLCLLWVIGVGQSIIASAALLYGLKLGVTSVVAFYAFNALQSVTYVTLIGALIYLFGSGPGRFMAIVLLLLQLTSAAGTFPLELVPSFFQALHPFLPMSYAVTEIRNIVAINDVGALWRVALDVAAYGVGALLVVLVYRSRRLQPKSLRVPDQLVS